MNKLFLIGNKIINWLFNGFIFLTLVFAITSPNLILGDNLKTGAGTTLFTTGWILIAILFIAALISYKKFRISLRKLFIENNLRTSLILFILVIIWQIIFVLNVHPPMGFDVGAVHEALSNTSNPEIIGYFSLNYNNIPILLVQHFIASLFAVKSWIFFDFITLILVDISAILNIFSVRAIDKLKTASAIYIHAIWLSVFPMIIVSYTDTWVLPLVSGYFFCYVMMIRNDGKVWTKYISAVAFAILAVSAYFIKPSSIVGVIAIVLIELLHLSKDKLVRHKMRFFKIVMVTILAVGVTYISINQTVQNQKYITSYQTRRIPAIHFVSMGVSGDGGYNPQDALEMAKIPTVSGRKEYSKKMLIKRLKKMGFIGYLKFLVEKHKNNTSDGTFAWVKEGHFINENPIPNGKGFAGGLKQFVYLYGKRLGDFRFLAQALWVIGLITIAFGWKDDRKIVRVMRLAIVGGFLYLLIFEGGRSRYLIQFLPSFLILMALLFDQSIDFFKKVYGLYNRNLTKNES